MAAFNAGSIAPTNRLRSAGAGSSRPAGSNPVGCNDNIQSTVLIKSTNTLYSIIPQFHVSRPFLDMSCSTKPDVSWYANIASSSLPLAIIARLSGPRRATSHHGGALTNVLTLQRQP